MDGARAPAVTWQFTEAGPARSPRIEVPALSAGPRLSSDLTGRSVACHCCGGDTVLIQEPGGPVMPARFPAGPALRLLAASLVGTRLLSGPASAGASGSTPEHQPRLPPPYPRHVNLLN